LLTNIVAMLMMRGSVSPAEGAKTGLYLALSPKVRGVSGNSAINAAAFYRTQNVPLQEVNLNCLLFYAQKKCCKTHLTQRDGSFVSFYLADHVPLITQRDGSFVSFYLADHVPLITPKLTPVNLSICLIDKPFFLSSLITSFLFFFS